jgi:hypothetical protein
LCLDFPPLWRETSRAAIRRDCDRFIGHLTRREHQHQIGTFVRLESSL